jgi:hypothetical protein
MKAKFGMIVTEGRGKIGGHVASKNRSGAYFRTKVTPVNPQTSSQSFVRQQLGSFSQQWRTLTQAQRDAWNSAVNDFSRTDIFGDLRQPTGKNLYTLLNINLANTGNAAISVPPLPAEVQAYTADSLTVDISSSTMDLVFSGSDASTNMIVEATEPLSPGVGFFKNRFRVILDAGAAPTSPEDLWAAYVAKFGAPVAGQKIAVRVYGINNTTGQASPRSVVSAIAVP